jgi:biotin operon repressor
VLGRTQINTAEVADALSLSVAEVNHAILSLEEKGVKVSNG